MTEFDFDAFESQFDIPPDYSLRARAAAAFEIRKEEEQRELLIAAHETIHGILGETNGTDPEFTPTSVELTIDNLRFKVEITYEGQRVLRMKVGHSWPLVHEVEDVGQHLAKDPCYVVAPATYETPRVGNFGRAGGTLAAQ
jgi:hypothetical protein